MRKNFFTALAVTACLWYTAPVHAQTYASLERGAMPMTTKSQQARMAAAKGLHHLQNVELERAYQSLEAAVAADPNLTVALSILANLSRGEKRKMYVKQAMESAAGKAESEKLFVDLLKEDATDASRREVWTKLKAKYPNDRVVGHFYVTSREKPAEKLAAALEYNKQFPEEAAMYNMLGYYHLLDVKDVAAAKTYFEKYMQLYPEGYNPYDSMGEFYLLNNDLENALKYYRLSLEKYPFNTSAIRALADINEKKAAEKK